MARCRGKHAETISQWGRSLHRLVRLHRAISHYPYVIMIDSKAVFSSHCAEPVTYKAMKTCPSLQMFKPASSILLLHGMNTLRPILLALTAAAALSFAQPASANLITNPGFETGDFTGWSQVNGRNALDWGEKLELDVWYVDHWSLWLDLQILWRTVAGVVRRSGITRPGHATMPEFQGEAGHEAAGPQPQ